MTLLFVTFTNPELNSLFADPIDRGILNLDIASIATQGTKGKSNLVNIIDSQLSSSQIRQKLSKDASLGTTKCTCESDFVSRIRGIASFAESISKSMM